MPQLRNSDFFVLLRGRRQCVGPFQTYDKAKACAPPDDASIVTGRWLNQSVSVGAFSLEPPQQTKPQD